MLSRAQESLKQDKKYGDGIDNTETIERIATDYWKAYETIVPQGNHIQPKAETYPVEGYNRFFRHFLARLKIKGL
jgi:IS1 family transposase